MIRLNIDRHSVLIYCAYYSDEYKQTEMDVIRL